MSVAPLRFGTAITMRLSSMPVKARRSKRRLNDAAEGKDWSRVFWGGPQDYLRQLQPFGIFTEEELIAAAPGAWARHGLSYLRGRFDYGSLPLASLTFGKAIAYEPWALRTFGWPKGTPA